MDKELTVTSQVATVSADRSKASSPFGKARGGKEEEVVKLQGAVWMMAKRPR